MARIKPKVVIETVQLTTRLPKRTLDEVDRYIEFLGGPPTDRGYVIEQALESALARDKNFHEWKDKGQRQAAAPTAAPVARPVTPTPVEKPAAPVARGTVAGER